MIKAVSINCGRFLLLVCWLYLSISLVFIICGWWLVAVFPIFATIVPTANQQPQEELSINLSLVSTLYLRTLAHSKGGGGKKKKKKKKKKKIS